jgi:hypothetical protein
VCIWAKSLSTFHRGFLPQDPLQAGTRQANRVPKASLFNLILNPGAKEYNVIQRIIHDRCGVAYACERVTVSILARAKYSLHFAGREPHLEEALRHVLSHPGTLVRPRIVFEMALGYGLEAAHAQDLGVGAGVLSYGVADLR